jgi:hypothetical protein
MAFLEFEHDQNKNKKRNNMKKFTDDSTTTASRLLSRVPPKIEAVPTSDLLSRVAAFLPQLAASNRQILQKNPEDVNIEVLNGVEGDEVIEMRLGLGVLEEQEKQSDNSDDCEDSKSKILVLPSELSKEEEVVVNDPFEKVIKSLLLFESDDDDEDEDNTEHDEDENMKQQNILEFDE